MLNELLLQLQMHVLHNADEEQFEHVCLVVLHNNDTACMKMILKHFENKANPLCVSAMRACIAFEDAAVAYITFLKQREATRRQQPVPTHEGTNTVQ